MNFETSADPKQQVTNLKQVIVRSEAAIAALQNLIRVADGKIRTIEEQSQRAHFPKPPAPRLVEAEPSIVGLKMFQ